MISEMISLLSDFIDRRFRDIVIGCVARVESFDRAKMRADVSPLLKYTVSGTTEEKNFSIISAVPVLFLFSSGYYIRPDYKRGDLVWVSFATHGISSALKGKNETTDGGIFARESAAVVSGLAPAGFSAPDGFAEEGVLIGHVDGNMRCRFGSDIVSLSCDVEIDGDLSVTGKVEADGEVSANSSAVPVKLSTHVHPTGVGPSGSPTPGT